MWFYVTCMRAFVHVVCSSNRVNDAFGSHLNRFLSLTLLMPVMKIMMMMVVLRHKVLVYMWKTFDEILWEEHSKIRLKIWCVCAVNITKNRITWIRCVYIHFNTAYMVSTIRNKFAFQSKTPKLNHHDLIQKSVYWNVIFWFPKWCWRFAYSQPNVPRCFSPNTIISQHEIAQMLIQKCRSISIFRK